jgi:hypothetical protein
MVVTKVDSDDTDYDGGGGDDDDEDDDDKQFPKQTY